MPIRSLDTDQKEAASSLAGDILVSAGAGSGKTTLLVSRYLYLALKEKLPLSSIAAITFTNKAADRMKSRIAFEASRLAGLGGPEAAFWQKTAGDAVYAPISTIHSFCSSILRSNPVESEMDPYFTVIEEFTAEKLKTETIDEYLDSYFSEEPDNASYLLDIFGIKGLKKIFRSLLGKRIHVLKFLDKIKDSGSLDENTIEKAYRSEHLNKTGNYIYTLEKFHAIKPSEDIMSGICDMLLNALKKIKNMIETGNVDVSYLFETEKSINLRGGSANKWGAENLADLKSGIKKCREFIVMIGKYYKYEYGKSSRTASLVMNNFTELEKLYIRKKKDLSCLDNDDILIETWKLLRNNSKLCGRISRSYRHILVDEFQDTDDLQMDILNMIAGNSSASVFVVGDEKQSIYRFRGADVTVFKKKLANTGIESFLLKLNYRSVPGIIDFVNATFLKVMGKEPEAMYEANYFEMKPYKKNENLYPCVEIAVFDIKNTEARKKTEADYIARKAIELNKKYPYKDMALLLRSRTSIEIFEEAFLRHGVPFVNLAGGKVPGSPEVYDVGNLLGWISNPEDTGLLVSLLMSPFFSIDPDSILKMREIAVNPDRMHTLVFQSDINKMTGEKLPDSFVKAAEVLKKLYTISDRVSIRNLIQTALDETNYTRVILSDHIKGERSLAVTDLLLRAAESFEKNGGGIRAFSEILLSGEEFTEESAHVESLGNSLRILTIHGAKGLEFDIVFLSGISGKVKRGGDELYFDEDLGPGFKILDERGRLNDTYVRSRSAELEKKMEIAESKRLFYVGCTRACKRMVISGTAPSKDIDTGFETDNWMNWLHSAHNLPVGDDLSSSEQALFKYDVFEDAIDGDSDFSPEKWRLALSDVKVSPAMDEPSFKEILTPLRKSSLFLPPQSLSPSQITDYLECPASFYYRKTSGASEINSSSGKGDGAEYGTFAHGILASIDFLNPDSWRDTVEKSVVHDIPQRFNERILSELSTFGKSDLYYRLKNAGKMAREDSFAFIHDDVLIRGTADLIFRKGEDVFVVDFKTDKNVHEPSGERLDGYRLQLGIYALAYSRAKYLTPGLLSLYYLANGKTVDYKCNSSFLDSVSSVVSEVIKAISQGVFVPRKCGKCAYCLFAGICDVGD